jgi:hypothetical protein
MAFTSPEDLKNLPKLIADIGKAMDARGCLIPTVKISLRGFEDIAIKVNTSSRYKLNILKLFEYSIEFRGMLTY